MVRSARRVAMALAVGMVGACGQVPTESAPAGPVPAPTAVASTTPQQSAPAPTATPATPVRVSRPVMPKAARDNTSRGAIAMVTYYHRVVDHGYRTGDTRGVLAEGMDCNWCREIAANIRANAKAQTFALTPLNTARPVGAVRFDARQYLVHIWHEVVPPGSQERVRGKVQAMKADTRERATWALYYSGGRWHMVSLGGGWCTVADVNAGRRCRA